MLSYLSKPFFQKLDYSEESLSGLGGALKGYMSTTKQYVCPEKEALEFYLLNHISQILRRRGEHPLYPHEREFMEHYVKTGSKMAMRAFYYLLIICTREARHLNTAMYSEVFKDIEKEYGVEESEFFRDIVDGGKSNYKALYSYEGTLKIGEYVSALCNLFNNYKWNLTFGGKNWGKIAGCLRDFYYGKISAEILLDTVWTLAHNTGSIFNKPALYQHSGSDLSIILDIQRSGQIPQLIADHLRGITYVPTLKTPESNSVVKYYEEVLKKFTASELRGNLDWYKVESLGSVVKYPAFRKKMEEHGITSPYKKKQKMLLKHKMKKKEMEQMEALKDSFVVDHNNVVKKVEHIREEV